MRATRFVVAVAMVIVGLFVSTYVGGAHTTNAFVFLYTVCRVHLSLSNTMNALD